jgi:hypothetical protein
MPHRAGLLGRRPEDLVQVRVLLEVLGLEVVVPQDVGVVLDELGALLVEVDDARLEVGVCRMARRVRIGSSFPSGTNIGRAREQERLTRMRDMALC